MTKHKSLAIRIRTEQPGNASSASSRAESPAIRQSGSLAPTVYCPSARVEQCLPQVTPKKTQ